MQVLVMAVQNAVPYEQLGVATSGTAMFRSIGGSLGVSLFGALFVWFMIFVTHIAFRKGAVPVTSLVGAAAIAAIFLSTWFVPALRSTFIAAGPWLIALAAGYRLSARARASARPSSV